MIEEVLRNVEYVEEEEQEHEGQKTERYETFLLT